MTDIFVVRAACGEYSDRDEWNVCYFLDEGQAKQFVERIGQLARAAARAWRAPGRPLVYYPRADDPEYLAIKAKVPDPKFDPADWDADEITYWLDTVPLGAPIKPDAGGTNA